MNTTPPSTGEIRLILMRHAKSDWANGSLSDHDRPLNQRGQRDTPEIAKWIVENGHCPDLILCSSAVRTRQTADLLLRHWPTKPPVFVTPRLYLASPSQIFSVVREDAVLPHQDSDKPDEDCDKIAKTVLVLAHNPGVSEAAGWLTGRMVAMPTAALVVVRRSHADWTVGFEPDQVETVATMKPKALPWRED